MGCAASQEDVKGKKGKKGKGKKGKGKKKSSEDDDENFAPISLDVVNTETKPEKIRKEINKIYKVITDKRDKLKVQLRPFLAERRGIMTMLDEEKDRLTNLLEEKANLETEKERLLEIMYVKDVDEIYRCYETKDKPGLVNIIGKCCALCIMATFV